jgi:hypothetical protein
MVTPAKATSQRAAQRGGTAGPEHMGSLAGGLLQCSAPAVCSECRCVCGSAGDRHDAQDRDRRGPETRLLHFAPAPPTPDLVRSRAIRPPTGYGLLTGAPRPRWGSLHVHDQPARSMAPADRRAL